MQLKRAHRGAILARRAPTQSLKKGRACRVKGNFRFIPDDTGRVQLKLDAAQVTAIDAPGPRPADPKAR